MKAIALSPKPRTYIPVDYRDEENPPEFTIRSLSKREVMQLQIEYPTKQINFADLDKIATVIKALEGVEEDENAMSEAEQIEAVALLKDVDMSQTSIFYLDNLKLQIACLKKGLLGWKNVPAQNGDEIEEMPFDVDDIEFLASEIILELVKEITGGLTEIDRKNSLTPSSSQNGQEMKVEDGIAEVAGETNSNQ